MVNKRNLVLALSVAVALSICNVSLASERRVIYAGKSETIKDGIFKNLEYKGDGAAVKNNGSLNIENSVFEGNKVTNSDEYSVEMKDGWSYDQATNTLRGTVNGEIVEVIKYPDVSGTLSYYDYNSGQNIIVGTIYNSGKGGAIYSVSDSSLKEINNSSFSGNVAKVQGGAVYYNGTDKLVVSGSKFTNNQSGIGNSETTSWNETAGGALYNGQADLEVKNSSFGGNSAMTETISEYDGITGTYYDGKGGAIYSNGNTKVENSIFTNNKAEAGGAIYQDDGESYNYNNNREDIKTLTVNNSKFENNTAFYEGKRTGTYTDSNGQKYDIDSNGNYDYTFLDETRVGGAIASWGKTNIKGSSFENNMAASGGAIAVYDDLNVENSTFKNNIAKWHKKGTDISYQNGVQSVKEYDENKGAGGAIEASGNNINIKSSQFENNESGNGNGGAVAIGLNNGSIIDSKFNSNITEGSGGAGYIALYDNTSPNGTSKNIALEIDNNVFLNNKAESSGGALAVSTEMRENNESAINILNSSFDSNSSKNGGGAIYIEVYDAENNLNEINESSSLKSNIKIANNNFTNNTSEGAGGALYVNTYNNIYGRRPVDGNLEIDNSTFDSNESNYHGGAAFIGTNGKINNSVFKNNKVVLNKDDSKDSDSSNDNTLMETFQGGGAIFSTGEINIDKTLFESNSSDVGGGAIKATNATNITNSLFISNNAKEGGAIEAIGSDVTIADSSFKSNSAKENGGAISSHPFLAGLMEAPNVVINDTSFTNNTAGKLGGAIYYSNNENTGEQAGDVKTSLTINAKKQDVVFTGNKAEKGNDIYLNNSTANLNASEGKSIIFNGGVAGNGVINTTGLIVLNSEITPDNGSLLLKVNSGSTIQTSVDNYINGIDLTLDDGATLDLRNGKIGVANINNLISNNGNVKIDMDLSDLENSSDLAIIKSASGTLNLKDINLLADIKGEGNNSLVSDLSELNLDKLSIITPENGLNILTNDYVYNIKIDGSQVLTNRLNTNNVATKVDGFTLAINQNDKVNGQDIQLNDERSFTALKDADITGTGLETGWTGKLGGTKLSVNGNGYNINGSDKSGIIIDNEQILEFNDANIKGFKTSETTKGALTIKDGGLLNIVATNSDVTISEVNAGDKTEASAIYLEGATGNAKATMLTANSKSITIDNDIRSANANNEIKMQGNGTILFNGAVDTVTLTNENTRTIHNNKVKDVTYNLNSGMVGFTKDSCISDNSNSINFNGGMLSIANGAVNPINIDALSLNANSNIAVDADLASGKMDTISAKSYNYANDDVKLNVSGINLLSDANKDNTVINFVNDESLKSHITSSVSEVAYSPIYKYAVSYDATQGSFGFSRGSSNNYNNINPAVMVSPVAAQVGGYLGMLDTYNNAFTNMDIRMLQPSSVRVAEKMANRYAITEPKGAEFVNTERSSGGTWVRPFTSYDSVGLKHGPKVYSTSYGSFFGGDTGIHELGNGFDGVFSAHISYLGSHQSFNGNSIYQNGGNIGLTGTLYKGNFFTGLSAVTGASVADASTMYGSETFPVFTTGVASKTGYNVEFKDGRFILQPSLLLSYTYVNTFNYTNAADVKIAGDGLHAVQINPNVKFIANTKNGWQPYLTFGINWNIMNDSQYMANATALPELSVKPFFQYGLGIQKLFGDNVTGYAQIVLRNGGRNGIAANAGFKYMFGKETL